MSKEIARNPESYANEELLIAVLPSLLEAKGFSAVVTRRHGPMKFVDATCSDGGVVTFWLKQGWTGSQAFAAIQFGMLPNPTANELPDSSFSDFVDARTASAKARGGTHALLVHMSDARIANYVALRIDDVATAYRAQLSSWPRRARNTKLPTLYFEDSRTLPDAACIKSVTDLEIPLEELCSGSPVATTQEGSPGARKITLEIERRMRQQVFRLLVGKRYGWTCPLTGTTLREVLDAAHLPGRNWRSHNEETDGILLRTDLHRLLDCGLAEIQEGRFHLKASARVGEYSMYHNHSVLPR
jgi:hypothetical protein